MALYCKPSLLHQEFRHRLGPNIRFPLFCRLLLHNLRNPVVGRGWVSLKSRVGIVLSPYPSGLFKWRSKQLCLRSLRTRPCVMYTIAHTHVGTSLYTHNRNNEMSQFGSGVSQVTSPNRSRSSRSRSSRQSV